MQQAANFEEAGEEAEVTTSSDIYIEGDNKVRFKKQHRADSDFQIVNSNSSNYESKEFQLKLCEVKLDVAKWEMKLAHETGIGTVQALNYVGYETYILLKQRAEEGELEALKTLLRFDEKKTFIECREDQRAKMLEVQEEIRENVKVLETRKEESRMNRDVYLAEIHCRGLMQIPNWMWIRKELELDFTWAIIDLIHQAILDNSKEHLTHSDCSDRDLFNASICTPLTGVLATTPDNFSVRDIMLCPSKGMQLNFPTHALFYKEEHFRSRSEEETFLNHLRLGHSFACIDYDTFTCQENSTRSDNLYYSTLRCCVVPLASIEIKEPQLRLSDEILSFLKELETVLDDNNQFAVMCDILYRKFGSHAMKGPQHYGGIFIWKCYSCGYNREFEKEIQALQEEIISSQLNIYGTGRLSKPLCVSGLDHIAKGYSEKLKDVTYTQIEAIGGPNKVLGYPDWKHGLVASKKTWHLIDRGTSQFALWDIIENNYKGKYSERLLKNMKRHWENFKEMYQILNMLGLPDWFPQKLSLKTAIEVREESTHLTQPFCQVSHMRGLVPHGRSILTKLMEFDRRCRIAYQVKGNESPTSSEDECSSSSDDDSCSIISSRIAKGLVHPQDCLTALFYCCDNILRQDIFGRMATCQLAVPFLFPHPVTKEPTLLLWALKSIVKEFKIPSKYLYTGRMITLPTPYVSFVRIGNHSKSKSEILNNVISTSDNRHDIFVHYNSPGGTATHRLFNGMVDMSWYLPSNEEALFSNPVAFLNLHGDASAVEYSTQVEFLCNICTVHIAMVSKAKALEKHEISELLTKLCNASGGIIFLQTHRGAKKKLKAFCKKKLQNSQGKISVVKYDTNLPEICEKLRKKIQKRAMVPTSYESLVSAAQKCKITMDEDENDCKTAKTLAEELFSIVDDYRMKYPNQSLRNLLNLQSGALWHTWAALDKEQYRQGKIDHYQSAVYLHESQTRRMSVNEYKEDLRRKMKEIRQKQFEKRVSNVMAKFINTLSEIDGVIMQYYMLWLKMKLDDLSREILPPLYEKIRSKRNELSRYQSEQNRSGEEYCQKQLMDLDLMLINASFGLEHLLRETSQIFEAVIEQDPEAKENMSSEIIAFPQTVAKLLLSGFPIELLDGDASHVPIRWISAVLESLSNLIKDQLPKVTDPKIFVLSVLGPQSTGKSTLLNALFGVSFSVGAGRCTRGAFMQLIPVSSLIQEKCEVNYFLIIDTEGLRAPERERLETFEHDNELGTFVIGMANLTLVTVSGEVTGDMDDILHTAVYAFLRMSQVQLKPRCHIIQQHLAANKGDEKLGMDRFRTKKNLDKMTQAAAKQTGLEARYTHFSDVIKFDYEEDVSLFPGLWTGRPPMAYYSTAYVNEVQNLKEIVISCSSDTYSIDNLQVHLDRLWKAILQEDFVFSFKNTFEMAAYKTLELQFSEWSWCFKKDMMEWENAAQNSLLSCSTQQVEEVQIQLKRSLQNKASEFFLKYAEKIKLFFEQKTNKIALKWEPTTKKRLENLCEILKGNAIQHCTTLYNSRNGLAEAERNKECLTMCMSKKVQQLAITQEEGEMSEDRMKETFEESWKSWIVELTATIKPLPQHHIDIEVEQCVIEFFNQRNLARCFRQNYNNEPFFKRGQKLGILVQESHIMQVLHEASSEKLDCKKYLHVAQCHANQIVAAASRYLSEKKVSDENYKSSFAEELLHTILKFEQVKHQQAIIIFGDTFEIDLVLNVCSFALQVFEEMAKAFKEKYDPFLYVEREMKPYFQLVFSDRCKKIKKEITAAEALCQQLDKPVTECVVSAVSSRIGDEMRYLYPWIKTKPTLLARILLEIGERLQDQTSDAFERCKEYLTDAKRSLFYWLKYFTEDHCDHGTPSRISAILKEEINKIISLLKEKAQYVTNSPSMKNELFSLSDWLRQFHSEVENKLNLPLGQLCVIGEGQEFPDVTFFLKEFKKKLEGLSDDLKKSYKDVTYKTFNIESHSKLYEEVSGCTEQCPFCKAQCEKSHENHLEDSGGNIKHETQHRPQCLGNFRWAADNTMILEVCSNLVGGLVTFRNERTDQTFQYYKKYAHYYPEWSIIADKSLEASLYWKWLLGHYPRAIEKMFGYGETRVPQEWKELKWDDVELWLKKEYKV